jgi:hypothetical protein
MPSHVRGESHVCQPAAGDVSSVGPQGLHGCSTGRGEDAVIVHDTHPRRVVCRAAPIPAPGCRRHAPAATAGVL